MVLKAIPGFKGYYASSAGHIYSIHQTAGSKHAIARPVSRSHVKKRRLKVQGDNDYPRVKLFSDVYPRGKKHFVHRLICETFNGPPPTDEHMCLHRDGNPLNRQPSNLRWGTALENGADRSEHEAQRKRNPPGYRLGKAVVTCIRERLMSGDSHQALAELFSTSGRSIFLIGSLQSHLDAVPPGYTEWRKKELTNRQQTNERRKRQAAEQARKPKKQWKRLEPSDVLRIRELAMSGQSKTELARIFEVSFTAISKILRRKCYRNTLLPAGYSDWISNS